MIIEEQILKARVKGLLGVVSINPQSRPVFHLDEDAAKAKGLKDGDDYAGMTVSITKRIERRQYA